MAKANEKQAAAQKTADARKDAVAELNQKLTDAKTVAAAALSRANAAGDVQESVQKAYDKVATAIDALQKLTAQSEVDQSQYDALVKQYEQAAYTYEEALKGKGALDADVDALSGAVQDALDAANGVFKTAPSGGSGGSGGGSSDGDSGGSGSGSGAGGTNTPAAPGGNSDLTDIGDAAVPLADGVSENAQGEEHAEPKNTDAELVSIGDVDVPPADAVGGRSGAPGAVAAACGAVLVLGKRRKKDESR